MPSLYQHCKNLTKQSTDDERYVTRAEFEKTKMEPYPINNDESSTNQPKLLDKDKLILVYYYNFGDKDINTGSDICTKIKQMLDNTFDYSVIPLVIPIVGEDTPTHIEILNNETLTPKQFEQIKHTEKFLKEIVNKQK